MSVFLLGANGALDMLHNLVISVKTGIQREILGRFVWIPAYAGMTCRVMQHVYFSSRNCKNWIG